MMNGKFSISHFTFFIFIEAVRGDIFAARVLPLPSAPATLKASVTIDPWALVVVANR